MMSNKIVFDDGKEVALSKETTERLRKELLKSKRFFDIADLRICRRGSDINPAAICVKKHSVYSSEDWNGMSEDYVFELLDVENMQKVVNVLQEIIDDFEENQNG